MKRVMKNIIAGAIVLAAAGSVLGLSMLPNPVEVEQVVKKEISQNITESGLIEADEPVTVYAPISGKLAQVTSGVNDAINTGDILAMYDLADAEERYNKAELNAAYYEDGYIAALKENEDYIEKAENAKSESNSLNVKYDEIVDRMNEISAAYNANRSTLNQSIQKIEGEISNIEKNLSSESSKLANDATNYEESQKKLENLGTDIDSLNVKIEESKELIESYQDEMAKCGSDSPAYSSYKVLMESEKKNLTSLKNERDEKKEEKENLELQIDQTIANKETTEGSVEGLETDLADKKKALSSTSLQATMSQQYEEYMKLSKELDVINNEWDASLEEQKAAEDKILSDTKLKQYEDSAALAKAEQESAQKDLEIARQGIKASISGTIIDKLVDKGAVTEMGTPLFVIQPSSGYKASILLSREELDRVKAGQKAKVKIGDKSYNGQVSDIGQIASSDSEGEPRVRVVVSLDDENANPTIGIDAQIEIMSNIKKTTLSISEKAVHSDDKGEYVYVLNDGMAEKRIVTTGTTDNGYTIITNGITENDTIITTEINSDDEGKKLRVKK